MANDFNLTSVSSDIRKIKKADPSSIKRIGLFGSLVRGDYSQESDIDILIEYDETTGFDLESFTRFCDFCNRLSDELNVSYGREVDMVHFEGDVEKVLFAFDGKEEIVWL